MKVLLYIWSALNLLFLAGLIAVKTNLVDPFLIARTTATATICMRGYLTLILMTALVWGGGAWIGKGIIQQKWGLIGLGLLFVVIGLWHTGQWVVREDSRIHEHFFKWRLKSADYNLELNAYNLEGYDKSFHDLSSYPCYEYCNHFFTRSYQVDQSTEFIVYKGLGPLFALEKDEWTPQTTSN